MKKQHRTTYIPGYFLLAACLFSACKKDNDQPRELVAFVSPDFQPNSIYSYSAVIKRTPNGSTGDSSIALPPMVRLTRALSSPVTVVMSIDTALVTDYNKKNNTTYKVAPPGTYKIELAESVTIPAGETGNKDSARIILQQPAVFAGTDQYLVPLRLKTASNGVSVSTRVGTLFILLKATINQTNINDALTTPVGTPIDRKTPQWKIASVSGEQYGKANTIFDGNFTTAWMTGISGNPANANFTVDMGNAYTLKAITVTPGYLYGSQYNSSTIQVLTSADNTTWNNQGTYDGPTFGGSATNPDTRALNFFMPINARYLRLVFTKGSGYAGVSELNAYQ